MLACKFIRSEELSKYPWPNQQKTKDRNRYLLIITLYQWFGRIIDSNGHSSPSDEETFNLGLNKVL